MVCARLIQLQPVATRRRFEGVLQVLCAHASVGRGLQFVLGGTEHNRGVCSPLKCTLLCPNSQETGI